MAEGRQRGPPHRPQEYGDAAPHINPQTLGMTLHWCNGVNTVCAEKGEWGLSCIPQRAATPVTEDLSGLSPANTGGRRPHSTASTASARHIGEDWPVQTAQSPFWKEVLFNLRTICWWGTQELWRTLVPVTTQPTEPSSAVLLYPMPGFSSLHVTLKSVMLTNHIQTTFTSGKWSEREPPHFKFYQFDFSFFLDKSGLKVINFIWQDK